MYKYARWSTERKLRTTKRRGKQAGAHDVNLHIKLHNALDSSLTVPWSWRNGIYVNVNIPRGHQVESCSCTSQPESLIVTIATIAAITLPFESKLLL